MTIDTDETKIADGGEGRRNVYGRLTGGAVEDSGPAEGDAAESNIEDAVGLSGEGGSDDEPKARGEGRFAALSGLLGRGGGRSAERAADVNGAGMDGEPTADAPRRSAAGGGILGAVGGKVLDFGRRLKDPAGAAAASGSADIEIEEAEEKPVEWTEDVEELPFAREMLHISHLRASERGGPIDRVVRSDGVAVVIYVVEGSVIELPQVGAFAGAINSLQQTVQFLVRQHQPRLRTFREDMRADRGKNLSETIEGAADSLDRMLERMETREGLMDRRFYLICREVDMEEVMAAFSRCQLAPAMLADGALKELLLSVFLGQSPADIPDQKYYRAKTYSSHLVTNYFAPKRNEEGMVENPDDLEELARYRRTIEMSAFPRNMQAGFLQNLFAMGIPMDVSMQVFPIPTEQAIANLESQRTKMQAQANQSIKRTGQVGSQEQIALEDIMRLRDSLMRGTERMFRANISITIVAGSQKSLDEYVAMIRSIFTAVLAHVDELRFVQVKALAATLPLCYNPLGHWGTADTTTMGLMYPYSPADLDRRRGTLVGLDTGARALITFDLFDKTASQNMNTAVLATSGAGKSFSAKLFMLRQMQRGVIVYVIDPEGEYVDSCLAAGGRVATPGVPGQGMNPFLVSETGPELNERIGNLKRLLQVMINERLPAETLSRLDNVMVDYYRDATSRKDAGTFRGLFAYMNERDPDIANMVRPFATGSSRYLLSDEGTDLLGGEEPPMTVFNLRLVDEDMRAAAGMVCSETVWTMAARDPRPRLLVADEVWSIIAHPEGAAFMLNSAKRARKHQLGLMSITQDVQDLLTVNSEAGIKGNSGRALLQNASYKLLLRQDSAVVPAIQETFQLNPGVAAGLAGMSTGHGILIAPDGIYPIQIEATREEVEIIEWRPGLH